MQSKLDVNAFGKREFFTEKQLRNTSFITMFLLSFLSVIFAFYVDNLQSLIKLTFSISAGVAPVYILRWIWFRINAWSQLSAMLSSAVFTLVYPTIHDLIPLKTYPLAESRVLVVTLLTTFVWVLVTFLTTNQNAEVRLKMLPILGSRHQFVERFGGSFDSRNKCFGFSNRNLVFAIRVIYSIT